jgi:opacity protein-like surface antigen
MSIKTALVGGLMALGFSSVALAADMPRPPVYSPAPKMIPADTGGWYLRGDAGYTMYNNPEGYWNALSMFGENLDNAFLVGVGVGYQYNAWLRTDVTVDYRFNADFQGYLPCACSPLIETTKLSVGTALINGYFDLGTWHGFTPYVGAGAGIAMVKTGRQFSDHPAPTPDTTAAGDTRYNFAWALMAGMSYDITPGMKFDTSYRYIHFGDGRTKALSGFPVRYDDLNAHEVRVGLRYMFD